MAVVRGFAPLVGRNPRILILGSMPSVASLEKSQYYGKPQNAFWKIMGELLGADSRLPFSDLSYEQRVKIVTDAGIAVWDVLASCVRPGSLDSAIDMQTAEVNDFLPFFERHDRIAHVFFNGRKAEDVFVRRVMPDLEGVRPAMRYACLPSTSPAMAAMKFAAKLEVWQIVHRELVQRELEQRKLV
jgi:hypoxanthine-DNA glycosylase